MLVFKYSRFHSFEFSSLPSISASLTMTVNHILPSTDVALKAESIWFERCGDIEISATHGLCLSCFGAICFRFVILGILVAQD